MGEPPRADHGPVAVGVVAGERLLCLLLGRERALEHLVHLVADGRPGLAAAQAGHKNHARHAQDAGGFEYIHVPCVVGLVLDRVLRGCAQCCYCSVTAVHGVLHRLLLQGIPDYGSDSRELLQFGLTFLSADKGHHLFTLRGKLFHKQLAYPAPSTSNEDLIVHLKLPTARPHHGLSGREHSATLKSAGKTKGQQCKHCDATELAHLFHRQNDII
mmetsp:Transcript_35882/g.65303  ORF Transcript_35882/g.65303 Transcript_35882/m.65303 type:complete len:215 (+) Transcript_35882:536-1180(+)